MLLAALSELPALAAVLAAGWLCIEHDAPGWIAFFAVPWVAAAPRATFAVIAAAIERAPYLMATVFAPETPPRLQHEMRLRYVCPKGAGHVHVGYSVCGVWLQPATFLLYAFLPGPWAVPPGEPLSLHVATHVNTALALAWTLLCVHRDWVVLRRAVVLPRAASVSRGRIMRGGFH